MGSNSRKAIASEVPEEVVGDIGCSFELAQPDSKHSDASPWKGKGRGVFEILERFGGDTWRSQQCGLRKPTMFSPAFQKKLRVGHQSRSAGVELVHNLNSQ